MPQLARSRVIEAAQASIAWAEHEGHYVSPDLRKDLMDVARTTDVISVEWSVPSRECGCLVGTARMRRGQEAYPAGKTTQKAIGYQFPEELLGKEYGRQAYTVFDIVDDDPTEVQGMDIGKEERTIIVEPTTTPVPQKEPVPAKQPVRTPAPDREPAKQ